MRREPWMSDVGFESARRVERQLRQGQAGPIDEAASRRSSGLRVAWLFVVSLGVAAALRPYLEPWIHGMNDRHPWLLFGVLFPLAAALGTWVLRRVMGAIERDERCRAT